MSKRIYVIFKPEPVAGDFRGLVRRINEAMPGMLEPGDDGDSADFGSACYWAGYMERPSNCDVDPDFPYLWMMFYCYWDTVLNGLTFRKTVKRICEAAGSTVWWYMEEESLDMYDDMSTAEFEKALSKSAGIERFVMPRYFPTTSCNIFMDSSERVNTAME
ncbi:MAG: hypothetical protein K2L14_02925 [Duncaniella sp.]|nr:hypothetical protein [Duncaniella sp.]